MNLEPHLPTLITCAPGPAYFGVTDLHVHHLTQVADKHRASEQHDSLIQTIEQAGTKVINLEELPGHPNSVFTKDPAVCTPQGYIQLRMGLLSREGEEPWMAEKLDRIGVPCIKAIEAPGTVEGGDVILAEKVAFIGQSSRTNAEGVRQISHLLGGMGYEIRAAVVHSPFLHIGGSMTLVSPDTILCVRDLFQESFFKGFQRIELPPAGFISGNVIPLSNRQVIADQANLPAITALRQQGFKVYPLDLTEFVKGTGGPSCLILQVK
ncbi:MAG: amidinotransferase [Bacteroidales bacterium]|nr:amidinotransferase [Bacteroidales bacterium]